MEDCSGLIYLVRHCATRNDDSNHPVLLGRQLDAGLSPVGQLQARRLAQHFADKELAAVYTSPLARAVRTAQVIGADMDAPMTFCPSITEADMGEWEGKTYDQIKLEPGDRYDRFLRDPGTNGYPGGENLAAVSRRMLKFLARVANQHRDEHVLVVSHKQAIRAALAGMRSLPLHRARELDQDPGCINLIRISRSGLELKAVNWTASSALLAEVEEESWDSASGITAM